MVLAAVAGRMVDAEELELALELSAVSCEAEVHWHGQKNTPTLPISFMRQLWRRRSAWWLTW